MAKLKNKITKNPGEEITKENGTALKPNGSAESTTTDQHLSIQKTYKLYIGGKFPRTESGRYYKLLDRDKKLIANVCQGSRKDFRNAVVAARKAQSSWAKRTAFNRSQILYRIAEMLEGRKAQFVSELMDTGLNKEAALAEVNTSIDRLVHYAGWADKYQQIFSSVNPVASSHFNFSVLEPMGVIAVFAPETPGLLGLISSIIPAVTGGNTVVVLASHSRPHCAISFAEVLNSSDVPGGVINILTGLRSELLSHFSTHMDVNALIYCGAESKDIESISKHAVNNLKRVIVYRDKNWEAEEDGQSPYFIADTQETKTTWHPIEPGGGSGGGY